MLKIIDTNYVLRYLIQDDIEKAKVARDIISEGAYILPESLVEIVYVLQKGYNVNRKEIGYAVLDLLQDVDIFDKVFYEDAIKIYRDNKLDYVDCLLLARHKLFNDKIFTFDAAVNKKLNQ